MPQSDVNQPGAAGAIDRLTLTASEVRGVDSSMPGACLVGACSACACSKQEHPQSAHRSCASKSSEFSILLTCNVAWKQFSAPRGLTPQVRTDARESLLLTCLLTHTDPKRGCGPQRPIWGFHATV